MFLDSKLQRNSASLVTRFQRRARTALALCGALALGCAAPPKPAAPKKPAPGPSASIAVRAPLPPEPALPVLTASTLPAIDAPGTFELTLHARGEDGAFELLEYELPPDLIVGWGHNEVTIAGKQRPYAFYREDPRDKGPGAIPVRLWVRRPIAEKGQELNGDTYAPGAYGEPGKHSRLHAAASTAKADPKLIPAWAEAFQRELEQHRGAFYGFAASELAKRANKPKPTKAPNQSYLEGENARELADLIGTTTGRSSVQEALEQHRGLYLDLASGPRKTPLDKLLAPRLTRHPWATMLGQLKQKPTAEPLAKATPADFYFLRVRDFAAFLDLGAVADSWGTPALDLLDQRVQDRGLRQRYQTELALEQGELARTFGPSVVEELALVGSDPYLVEGSDLTLIFKVKSGLLFDGALAKSLSSFAAQHPGGDTQKFTHEGVDVSVMRSADGQIRRHRASVDGLELVSNSPGAIKRVISAIHGKTPRLGDEPDFSYMLARDAELNEHAAILAFAGDRFVETVIGPQQKIKEAERVLALAELARPGYAALLYGFLNGHAPASANELVHDNLLSAADLRPNGVAAGWQPGMIARDARGSALDAMPLIDSPDVKLVTSAEKSGYEQFAREYESAWSDYVDPFAVRVSRAAAAGGGTQIDAELRVLPLLRREYREYTNSVGNAHVNPGPINDGFRMLLGVGKDAELRRLLGSATRALTERKISFDWLGDYAFIGVADRHELALAARYDHDISPEKPGDRSKDEELRAAAMTPAYAGIAVRSTAAAAVALAVMKRIGDEVAPDTLQWSEARKHRGVSVMCIRGADRDIADLRVYYALTEHALLFSLNPGVLETLIDEYADGKAPVALDDKAGDREAQLVVDFKGKPNGGLTTVLSWLLTRALIENTDRAVDAASAVFHGAPELAADPQETAELMRNYFGSVALTPEGKPYTFGPDGVRDPLRGSASSPAWPVIPVAGSPVANVVDRLASLRSEIAFDPEPSAQPGNTLQSLRVHLAITLR